MIGLDLRNRFTYHRPVEGMPTQFRTMRAKALELALLMNDIVPDGRELSLAITNLEEAVMWANAGLARTAPMDDDLDEP